MTTSHTPAPWTHDVYQSGRITDSENNDIAIIKTAKYLPAHNADARLIAAAPAMLDALRVIACQSIGDDWTPEQAITFIKEHARAAIAKATGE